MAWEDGWSTFVFWEKPKRKECTRDVQQKTDCQAVRTTETERRSVASKTKGGKVFAFGGLGDGHTFKRLQRVCLSTRNGEESVLTKIKRMSLPGEAFILPWRSLISTSPFQSPRCKVWRYNSRLPNGLIKKQLKTSDSYCWQFNCSTSITLNSIRQISFRLPFYSELPKRGRKWCNTSLYRYAERKATKPQKVSINYVIVFWRRLACVMPHAVLLLLSLLAVRCGGCNYDWEVVTNIKRTIDSNPAGFVSTNPVGFLTFSSCLHKFSTSVPSVCWFFSPQRIRP